MDLLTGDVRNDMSVVTWAQFTKIDIEHSDQIASDAGWPVQGKAAAVNPPTKIEEEEHQVVTFSATNCVQFSWVFQL